MTLAFTCAQCPLRQAPERPVSHITFTESRALGVRYDTYIPGADDLRIHDVVENLWDVVCNTVQYGKRVNLIDSPAFYQAELVQKQQYCKQRHVHKAENHNAQA